MPTMTDQQFAEVMKVLSGCEKLYRDLNSAIGVQLSQADAYRKYGRVRVNRWAREGRVQPVKQGARIYYDAYDLMKSSRENQL